MNYTQLPHSDESKKKCESKLIGAIKIRSEGINLIKKDVNDFKFIPTLTGEILQWKRNEIKPYDEEGGCDYDN